MYNHEPKEYKCPLCVFVSGNETALNKKSDIVFEDDDVVAYISPKWWKNNAGNVMVIPKKHIENIYDISDELLSRLYTLSKRVSLGMKETYQCDGTSFRQHNEPAGNQEIWHFHIHVFPRWENDDLYLNHKKTRLTTMEERVPYAEKLKKYLSQ